MKIPAGIVVAAVTLASVNASAAEPTKPAPYALPWLLRPAVPATVVRVDETLAFYQDPATLTSGTTAVTSLITSYKLGPRWAALGRASFTHNAAPSGGPAPSGSGASNLLLGVNFSHPFGEGWRWTAFLGIALPVASGSGDAPDPGKAAAQTAAISARSGMENALFAVNYWTAVGGLGLARITPGLTLQAEVTVLQLTRARGPTSQDASRTNFTFGLHAARFFSPRVSAGAELRLQRWLTDAAPVRRDSSAREQATFGLGPRFHFKLGKKSWFRPGLSYSRAIDASMSTRGYDILQIDAPVSF
jgi:hypothetical protein